MTDRIGNKYGRWMVISTDVPPDPYNRPQVKVECRCGTVRILSAWTLHKGVSTSCGCYSRDRHKARAKRYAHDGKMMTIAEISAALGMPDSTVRYKIKRGKL